MSKRKLKKQMETDFTRLGKQLLYPLNWTMFWRTFFFPILALQLHRVQVICEKQHAIYAYCKV